MQMSVTEVDRNTKTEEMPSYVAIRMTMYKL